MRKWKYTLTALGLIAVLATGCQDPAPTTAPTTLPTTVPTTSPTTEPTTAPTTVPTTEPILTGWQETDGKRYYYDENGNLYLGWLTTDTGTYYLDYDGAAATGWADIGDHTYFFEADGAMHTGWLEDTGRTFYFQDTGIMAQGWVRIDEKQYYFAGDGAMHTGWLYRDGNRYYFLSDGSGAVGQVEIDGKTHHFTPAGIHVILVNPWHYLPDDYETELVSLEGLEFSAECADALKQMLAACRAAGHDPLVRSGYRSTSIQRALHEKRIQKFIDMGYNYDTAVEEAKKIVAVPGTSEHQLGLAADIVDRDYPKLLEPQEKTETQQWLMKHCWEYGFILRYPNGTTDITGIIYEPWHYRYVGVEIALELRELGITLEEYLGAA